MITPTGFTTIQTDETFRETITHGSSDYAFKFYDENMDMFDFRSIDWHWHSELEIVLIERGAVNCYVGKELFTLNEGDAVFINTKVIHKITAEKNAVIPNILFAPSFLSSEETLIYKKYILPILQSGVKVQVFSSCRKECQKILQLIKNLIVIQRQEELKELLTKQVLLEIWSLIYKNTDLTIEQNELENSSRGQAMLQLMMQFIQQNYADSITLEDIAACVNVSKSTALNIFAKYLNDTPVNYLISFRLKKAADLLKTTEKKIDYIAQETGFESDAYFCRRFKNYFGITPGMYRKTGLK